MTPMPQTASHRHTLGPPWANQMAGTRRFEGQAGVGARRLETYRLSSGPPCADRPPPSEYLTKSPRHNGVPDHVDTPDARSNRPARDIVALHLAIYSPTTRIRTTRRRDTSRQDCQPPMSSANAAEEMPGV
jgi:hypothetical protein